MKTIHILLANTNTEFTATLTEFLSRHEDLKVAGWAISSREVLDYVNLLHPDLVLLDFSLPSLDTLEMIHQLKTMPEAPCIVMIAPDGSREYRAVAHIIAADGFVAKSNIDAELLPVINRLFAVGSL